MEKKENHFKKKVFINQRKLTKWKEAYWMGENICKWYD